MGSASLRPLHPPGGKWRHSERAFLRAGDERKVGVGVVGMVKGGGGGICPQKGYMAGKPTRPSAAPFSLPCPFTSLPAEWG